MSPRLTHRDASPCKGFTLTELLVAVAIILVLLGLISGAASAARNSQKTNATRSLIDKLDAILMTQIESYNGRSVDVSDSSPLPAEIKTALKLLAARRAWAIRRNMISGDLPDRWTDVEFMFSSPKWVPASTSQSTYINLWRSAPTKPSSTFAGAECLFMIVMQGGIADCLDCGSLKTSDVGDQDNDGFMEFLDAWGNPIGYILWPAAIELPAGTGRKFFSDSRALQPPATGEDVNQNWILDTGEDTNGNGALDSLTPTLGMRPLIYSAGPDGEYGFDRNSEKANLGDTTDVYGLSCGDWTKAPTNTSASPNAFAADNITNLDDEAKR